MIPLENESRSISIVRIHAIYISSVQRKTTKSALFLSGASTLSGRALFLSHSFRTNSRDRVRELSLSLCAVCKLGENLYHCGERCRRLTPTGTTWTALYDSTLCLLESSYAHPHERWKRHLSVGVQRTRTRRAPCALHTLLGAGAKTAGSLFAQELRHIR